MGDSNSGRGSEAGVLWYLFELGLGLWHCGGKLRESAECRVAEQDGDAQVSRGGKKLM